MTKIEESEEEKNENIMGSGNRGKIEETRQIFIEEILQIKVTQADRNKEIYYRKDIVHMHR